MTRFAAARRLALCLLAAAGPVACRDRGAQIDELIRRAENDLRSGRYVDAAMTAAQADGLAHGHQSPDRRWPIAILRAELALLQGNVGQATALMRNSPAEAPPVASAARAEKVRGYLALKASSFGEAANRFARAEQLARASGNTSLLLELQVLAGRLLWDRGERDRAEQAYEEAARAARAAGDLYFEAAALNNLGFTRMDRERFAQALPLFWQARAAAGQAGADSLAAVALTNLGRCYCQLGEFDRSRMLLEKGASILQALRDFTYLQYALGEMGSNLLQFGDLTRARGYLERALALARQYSPTASPTWIRRLTALELEAGRWLEADRYHEQVRAVAPGPRDRELVPEVLLDRAAIRQARGDHVSAETLYTRVLEHPDASNLVQMDAEAGLARVNLAMGRFSAADRFFSRARLRIAKTRTSLDTLEQRLSFLSSLVKVHRDYVERLVDRGRTTEALAVVEGTRARVLAERFGNHLAAASDLRLTGRARGELLLSYWVAPRRSHLWAVTGSTIEHFLLPGETQLRAKVEAAQALIARGLRDPRLSDRSPARELYEILLGPVADRLARAGAVVIAPDGPLHGLSFAALVTPGRPARFLAEQVALAVAPSLTLLPMQSARPLDLSSGPVIAVGDPLSGEAEFPPLAKAGLELESLERHFGNARVQVFGGEAAQPDLLRSMKGQRLSILHFAAHAVANPASPLDSTIVLSPGAQGNRFSAREALELGIGAEVVTLSACRSALARSYFGEGPVGLAWAFLSGGSSHVVAGLWDVPDDSTARLMDRFYGELRAGHAVPQALQRAQLALINSAGSDRLPYHWAPFIVYLGPRPTPTARGNADPMTMTRPLEQH